MKTVTVGDLFHYGRIAATFKDTCATQITRVTLTLKDVWKWNSKN